MIADFEKKLEQIEKRPGFLAALDQSGGSTPKALAQYGIASSSYSTDEEMFSYMHQMRSRIFTSPAFDSHKVIATILFERTMKSDVDGIPSPVYLWQKRGIVPIVKIDKGLEPEKNGVQLMKPIPGLDTLLPHAADLGVFGTKERSVIHQASPSGVEAIVRQQFEIGEQVRKHGLVPILEPEVSIKCPEKKAAEKLLHDYVKSELEKLPSTARIMLKITIPDVADLYDDIAADPRMVRVVALSGGYSLDEACEKLRHCKSLIASFSRALIGDLRAQQTDEEFDKILHETIDKIYDASKNKD